MKNLKDGYINFLKELEDEYYSNVVCDEITWDEYISCCFMACHVASHRGVSDNELLRIFPEEAIYGK